MRKLTSLLIVYFIFCAVVVGQNIEIKGTVRSAKDSSVLQGVSVTVKGISHGTITSTTGNYSISCPAGTVLVFTSLGYTSEEVAVDGKTQIDVLLVPATENQLGDVVVTTALGIKKEQKSLGYAVQEVKGTSIEKIKSPTVMGALVGKVAGLDIANTTDLFQSPSVSLRGETPLIVIDGIPDPSADPYKINADDIESITVLKGTAAGALYGSIGQHGAILYTTKKGSRGTLNVEANSSTMFQTGYTVIPKVQTEYGDGDQGSYAYVDGSGGGTEGGGWIWGPKLDQKDASTPSGYYETTQYNSPVDPKTGELEPLPWISRGKNNIKNFFQAGLLSTNSISASVGGDKGSFRISASHVYQKGLVPNTSVNNSTFSVGGNYALTSKLNVDTKLTFNREYSNNYPTVGYGPQNILYNLILWIGADVDIRDLKNYWVPGEEGLQQRNYNLSWYNNPYFVAYQLLNGYRKDNTYGQVTFNYQFNKDLSLKLRNGFNEYAVDKDYKEPQSYIAYSYISKGNYSVTKENYLDIASDLILTYNHTFSKNLNVNVTAGASNTYTNYKSDYVTTDGLTIPGFYNLANSTNPLTATNTLQERRITSFYGMADIEAMNFLYFSFTGRRDQTSTLPLSHDAYFYPSAGISAVLSDVLKLPDVISFLKVRASWAQVNSGVISQSNPYAFLTTYGIGNKWDNIPSLTWPAPVNGNSNYTISSTLIPNTTVSGEYGTTIGLLKNRINIDATYFRNLLKNNFDYIYPSQASGYSGIMVNANNYVRKGWEFVVSGTPVKNSRFTWETGFNFSNNHTWLQKSTLTTDGYLGTYLKEGRRTDGVYISQSQTPDGRAIYNANGFEATDPYSHLLGYSDPKWIYGWQNTFTYKNFSLGLSFDGRLGGLIYSTTNQKMWWGGTALGTVNKYRDDANAGKATYVGPGVVVTSGNVTYDNHGNILTDTRTYASNTTAVNYISFMQSTSGDMLNNYFYYSGTYLKLRELSLTYNLPKKWIKGIFKDASVSLIGNNLFLWAKIPNVDPDAEGDNLQTPSVRSMGINLNIKF